MVFKVVRVTGLDNIHGLTTAGFTELQIDLEDWDAKCAHAVYTHFHVSGPSDNYRLNISGYYGLPGETSYLCEGVT